MQAILALEDGRIFRGHGYGPQGECQGEVVFNTSLTGYQEIATDPSYAGQIVVLTNPQIGNYGTNHADNEAARPYIEGLIVREFSAISSNWRSEQVTDEYMERYRVPVSGRNRHPRPGPPSAHPRRHARRHLHQSKIPTSSSRKPEASAKMDGTDLAKVVCTKIDLRVRLRRRAQPDPAISLPNALQRSSQSTNRSACSSL